jgi:biotin operon repressor
MSSRDQVDRKHVAGLIVFVIVIVMIAAAAIRPRHTAAVGIANKTVAEQQLNTKAIDQIIGRSGELKGDVYRIGLPRTDLKVTADGEQIKPGLALGSWMAFKRTDNHAMVMGDLVLLESEINPVLSKLEDNGIEISAIHNHLLNEQPRVMYIHYMGHGDEEKLARAMKDALALSATPMGATPSASPAASPFDWSKVQEALRIKGNERGGVLQVGVPRKETITTADGTEVPAFMGTATAINFQSTSKGVAITGDFALTANEVNPVIRELRKSGIQITALHSHMLDESPRLFFMHFWANDEPLKLARGLRAALEKTNSAL